MLAKLGDAAQLILPGTGDVHAQAAQRHEHLQQHLLIDT
jgi:hypothetical protein